MWQLRTCGIQCTSVVTMAMKVLHNTCNMCTCDLPDMNALISWACSPWALNIHIRQIPHAYVTTILKYFSKIVHILLHYSLIKKGKSRSSMVASRTFLEFVGIWLTHHYYRNDVLFYPMWWFGFSSLALFLQRCQLVIISILLFKYSLIVNKAFTR